jgi:hypothetical protein
VAWDDEPALSRLSSALSTAFPNREVPYCCYRAARRGVNNCTCTSQALVTTTTTWSYPCFFSSEIRQQRPALSWFRLISKARTRASKILKPVVCRFARYSRCSCWSYSLQPRDASAASMSLYYLCQQSHYSLLLGFYSCAAQQNYSTQSIITYYPQ